MTLCLTVFSERGLCFPLQSRRLCRGKLIRHLGAAGNRISRPAAAREPRRGLFALSLLPLAGGGKWEDPGLNSDT